FDNYGDLAPSDPLSKAVVDLSSSGKVVNAVFKGTPDGWGQNIFGAAVQAYISGEKTWDEVVKTAQDGWAEAKK
ncbi:MAG: carbohydrate ABC transporter substrate-binding protein, partial [Ruminococcaceae bacterium]|nr:carbohydrate ABC transporter substrate-binding protein [Oscillospiraceae bacterium]